MSIHVPLVALVGRPNVGKSTLFNRLTASRASLVHNSPGVTRDRIFGELVHGGRTLRVVDTGGIDTDPDDHVLARARAQTELAIEAADLIVLIVDGASGVSPLDEEIAQLLRRAGKAALLAVNKVDHRTHADRVHDFYGLGLDAPVPISAEHGVGVGELCEVLIERLDAPACEDVEAAHGPLPVRELEPEEADTQVEWDGSPVRVAIVGRPNVGKSSLANRLLGEERFLATPVAGTTRDAIDAELDVDGQSYVLVDTAGIRRKRAVRDRVERISVMVAIRAIERSDVVVLVVDATQPIGEQDAKIASIAETQGKAIVLVANKWDAIDTERAEELMYEIEQRLIFLRYTQLQRVSAKTGRGVKNILPSVVAAQQERHRRVGTSALNRFFREVVERNPPPIVENKRPRVYFVSQPLVRPPTFIFAVSRPDSIRTSYERFLRNSLRDRFGFVGTPVWLKFRGRGKAAKR